MAMGTEEVDHGTGWNIMFPVNREAPVKTRKIEPSVLEFEGDRDTDRWIAINVMTRIHQAVTATRTADFHRKDSLVRLYVDRIETHASLVENLFNLSLGHIGEIVAVDDDDGAQGARSETVDGLEGDLLVRGRLARFDSQLSLDLLGNSRSSSDVTGRAQAGGKEVFPPRFEAEGSEKRGNAIDIDQRMTRLPRDNSQRFFWEVTVPGLNILEDRDQSTPVMTMALNDLFNMFWIHEFFLSGKGVWQIMISQRYSSQCQTPPSSFGKVHVSRSSQVLQRPLGSRDSRLLGTGSSTTPLGGIGETFLMRELLFDGGGRMPLNSSHCSTGRSGALG
jgi:hypothetical protein